MPRFVHRRLARPLFACLAAAAFARGAAAQVREYIYMGDRLLAIEGPVIAVRFAAPGSSPTEAQDVAASVTVSVPGGGSHPGVSFFYTLLNDTAIAGQDFVGVNGAAVPVTIPPGQPSTTLSVDVINDAIFEDNETFRIVLSSPTGAVLGSPSTHVVTILDDEPTVEVVLAAAPVTEGPGVSHVVDVRLSLRNNIAASSSTVSFNFATSDGTAIAADGDYTPASGVRSFGPGTPNGTLLSGANRIVVAIGNDEIDEPNQDFFLDLTGITGGALGLSRQTVTIIDEDPTAALSVSNVAVTEGEIGLALAQLAVTLSRPSEFPVSVTVTPANGTALDAGRDFWSRAPTVLSFPLRTTSLPVRVPVVGDRVAESTESFFVNLSLPQNAIILDFQGEVSITDTDLSGLAVNHVSSSEGGAVVVTVTLPSAPAQTMTVDFETVPGTATPDVDYAPVSGTLTITPPASSATFQVKTFTDNVWEGGRETFLVRLSDSTGPVIAYPEATVTVVDPNPGTDFNRGVNTSRDVQTDLLWRHEGSGQVALWYMDRVQLSTGSLTNPSTRPLNWKVVGTGTFPPTLGWDLLWWDETTGNLEIWQMIQANRNTFSGTDPAGVADTRWKPVATGDFNADGLTDIVWRQTVSGEIVVWHMNGSTLLFGTYTDPPQLPPAWEIQGTGDFNADGKTDLVWRHATSGQLVVWFMDGTSLDSGTFMDPEAFTSSDWQLRVTRDFDFDGKPDLLWRHLGSGQNAIWWMDGHILKYGEFGTPLPDTGWTLAGPR